MISIETLTDRRDRALATYDSCGHPGTRAALLILTRGMGGSWLREERIWRHVMETDAGFDPDRRSLARIHEERGWSTTERVMLRVAAELADVGWDDDTTSVGDLLRLSHDNYLLVLNALDLAGWPSDSHTTRAYRSRILAAFDRTIERMKVPA